MKRYFKREGESALGMGIYFIEFDGERATRQVEEYNGRWFSSRRGYHPEIGPSLTDRSLSEGGFEPEHEISETEFEYAWNKAQEQDP